MWQRVWVGVRGSFVGCHIPAQHLSRGSERPLGAFGVVVHCVNGHTGQPLYVAQATLAFVGGCERQQPATC
jgi:hypothetical protein